MEIFFLIRKLLKNECRPNYVLVKISLLFQSLGPVLWYQLFLPRVCLLMNLHLVINCLNCWSMGFSENFGIYGILGPNLTVMTYISVVGFLPKHLGSRRKRLMVSADQTTTQIFYVPPHKLSQFLEESSSVFGDARY